MAKQKSYKLFADYFFQGHLEDREIAILEKILRMDKVEQYKELLSRGNITLRNFQTLDVALAYFNKRYFCGEKPGMGKTLIASALLKILKERNEVKKILAVTVTDSLFQMKDEIYNSSGVDLLPMYGDSPTMRRILKYYNPMDYDGIIIGYPSLINNQFNIYLAEVIDQFSMVIYDESSALSNHATKTWQSAKFIADNCERVLMLNATPFETHLGGMVNQFRILGENIVPKQYEIERDYCVVKLDSFWGSRVAKTGGDYGLQRYQKKVRKVVGYKNQDEFRDRLRYFYITRNKKDVYDQLPEHSYKLELVDMSKEQLLLVNTSNYNTILNSPTTLDKRLEFSVKTVPKLQRVVDLAEAWKDSSPVIYCFYKDAQERIRQELEAIGIKAKILNGDMDSQEKEAVRNAFNNGEFPVLITNVKRAINLPNSDVLIFYTIPTNPQVCYQIMGRIDRNNDSVKKHYFFLVYNDSFEANNLATIIKDREFHANMFTGSEDDVFERLVKQLEKAKREGEPEIDQALEY